MGYMNACGGCGFWNTDFEEQDPACERCGSHICVVCGTVVSRAATPLSSCCQALMACTQCGQRARGPVWCSPACMAAWAQGEMREEECVCRAGSRKKCPLEDGKCVTAEARRAQGK